MVDRDPTRTAAREARRRKLLGPDASCALCGVRWLEMLRNACAGLLEKHHVLGRAHDPELTIVLCHNCHTRATEAQRRGEVPMKPQSNVIDRAIAALKSLEAFLEAALDALARWIADLEGFLKFLDTKFPSWRKRWEEWK